MCVTAVVITLQNQSRYLSYFLFQPDKQADG